MESFVRQQARRSLGGNNSDLDDLVQRIAVDLWELVSDRRKWPEGWSPGLPDDEVLRRLLAQRVRWRVADWFRDHHRRERRCLIKSLAESLIEPVCRAVGHEKQVEDDELLERLLAGKDETARLIFYHALKPKSLGEIAAELGLSYMQVYRTMRDLEEQIRRAERGDAPPGGDSET